MRASTCASQKPYFERIEAHSPDRRAYARGWIANRDGVYYEALRGFGGQARTAARLLDTYPFRNVMCIGWVTSLGSQRRGAGRIALQNMLDRFDRASDVDVVGLIVLPDDDAFVERLVDYYGRFGFEPVELAEEYASSFYPVMVRARLA